MLTPTTPETPMNPDSFLKDVSGVVHIGANNGRERDLYASHNLRVFWIEAIPEVFVELQHNIRNYARQQAVQALVTDVDGREYQFNIANHSGSSSILDFKHHKAIWPEVKFTDTILLKSITLASLYKIEGIDPLEYQALVLDTQGSELLVLQGGVNLFEWFKYIKTEVADFEAYEGCCQLDEIHEFMLAHGYKEYSRNQFASHPDGGDYFDIVYKRLA